MEVTYRSIDNRSVYRTHTWIIQVGEMIHHFITSWPRNAYDGVSKSNIAVWLLKRVKDGVSLVSLAFYRSTNI